MVSVETRIKELVLFSIIVYTTCSNVAGLFIVALSEFIAV